jgi:hypothetical protein
MAGAAGRQVPAGRRARRQRGDGSAEPGASPGQPGLAPLHGPLVRVAVAGAHGGAGASTLAALLAPAWDLGPVRAGASRLPLPGVPVVLAVRCTVSAAAAAVAAVRLLDAHGAAAVVLVVTSDGLPEPAEAAYRFRVLEGRVAAVVRVPFIPALRAAGDPRLVRLPRRAAGALSLIRSLAAAPGGPGNPPAPRQ